MLTRKSSSCPCSCLLSALLAASTLGACAGGEISDDADDDATPIGSAQEALTLPGAALAVSAGCAPGAGQVAFFTDANFRGSCSLRGAGAYPNPAALGVPNDAVSSVLIGSRAQAILCIDNDFGGDCIRLTTSTSLLAGRVGNDTLSSAKVQALGTQECAPGPTQVGLFVHADFIAPCVVKNVGSYASPGQIGLPNDSISSLLVGSNAQVTLCQDNDFGGQCDHFDNDVDFLGNESIADNQASSASVQPFETCTVDDQRSCLLPGHHLCIGDCTQTCCHEEGDQGFCEVSSCN